MCAILLIEAWRYRNAHSEVAYRDAMKCWTAGQTADSSRRADFKGRDGAREGTRWMLSSVEVAEHEGMYSSTEGGGGAQG